MAMFGGLAKKRSPFDFTPPVYTTPGIGDDLPGAKPMGDPGLGMAVDAALPQKGGGWRDVLGVISEGLAGAAGNGPGVYMQSKMRDKEMQRQDSLYQRQRADQMVDWRAKQEWERNNPKPVNNDTSADFEYISGILGREAATQWLKNKTDPVVSIPVPGGTYLGPRSGLGSVTKGGGQSSGGPAIGAVEDGYRFKGGDPSKRESWEPVGGPTPPASGIFR